MAESNQNLVNSIGDPKGRVSVKLQPNRYAKEPSKNFFGRTVRNTHTVVNVIIAHSKKTQNCLIRKRNMVRSRYRR